MAGVGPPLAPASKVRAILPAEPWTGGSCTGGGVTFSGRWRILAVVARSRDGEGLCRAIGAGEGPGAPPGWVEKYSASTTIAMLAIAAKMASTAVERVPEVLLRLKQLLSGRVAPYKPARAFSVPWVLGGTVDALSFSRRTSKAFLS